MSLHLEFTISRATARVRSGFAAFVLSVLACLSPPFPADASVQLTQFGVARAGPAIAAAVPPAAPQTTVTPMEGAQASADPAGSLDATQQYSDLIRAQGEVGALDSGLLGERVDYYTGQTDFAATDVSLPGNFAIPMAVGRRYRVGNHAGGLPAGAFGDWDMELPHIEGVIATGVGWTTGSGLDRRCTYFGPPPDAAVTSAVTGGTVTTSVPSSEYGYGFTIEVPGKGRHEMLLRAADNPAAPGSGYPVVTHDWWTATCIGRAGTSGQADEAFLVTSPDGVTYTFDEYSARGYPAYQRPADTLQSGVMAVVQRQQVFFLPSTIEDRFGNWVSYRNYLQVGSQLLPHTITSSDGRTITITYSNGLVSSIFDGTRTWTYTYTNGRLSRVTLPDGSYWSIDFANLDTAGWTYGNASCTSLPTPTYSGAIASNGTVTGTIQHPSGASGTFTFAVTRRGVNGAPATCLQNSAGVKFAAVEPGVYDVLALTKKVITGPHIDALTWSLAYGGCTSGSCSPSVTTTLTDARNYQTLYTFGAAYNANADLDTEGQLQSLQSGGSGGNYLRTDTFTYFTASGHAYPSVSGTPAQARGDVVPLTTVRPVQSRTTTVDGATYTQTMSNPDAFGYAQTIVRTGTATKTDTLAYDENTSAWILGTLASRASAGATEFSLTLNSNELPTAVYRFGRKDQTFTYNADGTVASSTDGNNQTTRYGSYKRGIPRQIDHPDNGQETVAVDDLGHITQWNDANNYITTYAYDAMGRLNHVTQPGGYNQTGIAWTTGVSGWTRTLTHGSYTKTDTYDAFLRSVQTTQPYSTTVTRTFDADGRATFVSYPGSSYGTTSVFDGLGRLSSQTDGGGYTTTYTPGANVLTVKDRNGNATTYGYKTYDEPGTAWPVTIAAPLYTTTIARDTWGKPTSITRTGNGGGGCVPPACGSGGGPNTLTRTYAYNANQLLQSVTDPEAGTTPTTYTYDNAANIKTVDHNGVVTQTRSYDADGRLAGITYSNGDPAVGYTWYGNGLLHTAARGSTTRTLGYDVDRMLASETVSIGGTTYTLGYGHDTYGNPTSLTYPDNTTVSYSPDHFGRPTQIGAYAANVQYFPNGALDRFEYGNGIWHTTWQDARQLPKESQDQGIFDWGYTYDGNADPLTVVDYLGTGVNAKTFAYDAANRLEGANAARLWGNTRYAFDALDDQVGETTGSATTAFAYDSHGRLTSFGSPATPVSYDDRGDIVQIGTGTSATALTFDGANELTQVTQAGYTDRYGYDADGLRVTRTGTSATGPGEQVTDIYDHAGRLVYEAGTQTANPDRIFAGGFETPAPPLTATKYYYLGSHLVAKEAVNGGTVTDTYVHTDALGSPVATTDRNKAILGTTTYAPYGALYASTGTGNQAGIGYTGQYADATGLIYMRARYYSPAMHRFVSPDPEPVDANTALNFNRYSYASNSPYAKYDPSGRCATSDVPNSDGSSDDDGLPCPGQEDDSSILSDASDVLDTLNQAAMAMGPIGMEIDGVEELGAAAAGEVASAAESAYTGIEEFVSATVATPHGTAVQALTSDALALRDSVAEGQQIFRAGNFPTSAATEGQYWSTLDPLGAGYADSVGAANLGAEAPDFILGGTIRPGANFITRYAPPFGGNSGGALEIVTDPNAVLLNFFHMP